MSGFQTIENYDQLLIGAHRKPAPQLSAPSLIWHLAFWKTLAPRQGSLERRERKKTIDLYLQDIFLRLGVRKSQFVDDILILSQHGPNHPHEYVLFDAVMSKNDGSFLTNSSLPLADANQALTYAFKWHFLDVRMRFELHQEYLSLTSFIDLSLELGVNPKEASSPILNRVLNSFSLLSNMLKTKQDSQNEYSAHHEYLYNEIWRQFFAQVMHSDDFDLSKLGAVFADFKGLIIGSVGVASASASRFFQVPFYRTKDSQMPTAPDLQFDSNFLENLWPFLTCEEKVDLTKYEFTATNFLGGRALYVTALGAQPSILPSGDRFPLYYLFYVNTPNSWELGRLVDRINQLGTVRLAAIMSHGELRRAGDILREVEKEILAARAAILEMPTAAAPAAYLQSIHVKFSDIQSKYSKMTADFDGDIEYRIERARYYIKQFSSERDRLGILPIDGYQPYDAFVMRRLGSLFEFIDMLGIRIERVQNDVNSLFTYYLAQSNINIQLNSLSNETRIQKIQAAAELALLLFLLPYYGGNIADHIFGSINESDWTEALIWIGAFAFFLPFAILSFRENYSDKLPHLFRGVLVAIFGAVLFMLASAINDQKKPPRPNRSNPASLTCQTNACNFVA